MKKIITLLCVFLLLVTGCSSKKDSASTAVDSYFKEKITEMKKQDLDDLGLDQMFASDELSAMLSEEDLKKYINAITSCEYKINSEKVDGDTATVNITITTYDFGEFISNFFTNYLTVALSIAFSGASEEEVYAAGGEAFRTELDKTLKAGKTKQTTLDLTVNKVDGKWVYDETSNSDELLDALLGGMFTSLTETLEGLGSMFEDFE